MVGADADEAHDGEPYGEDLREHLTGGDGEEDSHCDKPIGKDATEEYLVPAWCHNLRGGENKDFLFVGCRFKDTTICESSLVAANEKIDRVVISKLTACQERHEEQHAREVTEEGNEPCFQKIHKGNSTMQESDGRKLL